MSTEHTVNVQVSPWANSWDSRGVLKLQKVGVNFYLGRYPGIHSFYRQKFCFTVKLKQVN